MFYEKRMLIEYNARSWTFIYNNPNHIRGRGDKLSHAMQKLWKSACVLTIKTLL